MKFDLREFGLRRILMPYQAEAMRFIWEEKKAGSLDVFTHLQCQDDRELKRSRASVINSLNMMVDEGLLTYRKETGKGGYHKIYSPVHGSEGEFRYWLAGQIRVAIAGFLEEYEEKD